MPSRLFNVGRHHLPCTHLFLFVPVFLCCDFLVGAKKLRLLDLFVEKYAESLFFSCALVFTSVTYIYCRNIEYLKLEGTHKHQYIIRIYCY